MYVIVIFIKSDREETSSVIDVMNVVNKRKKSNRFNFFGGSPLFTDLVSDVETVNYFSRCLLIIFWFLVRNFSISRVFYYIIVLY